MDSRGRCLIDDADFEYEDDDFISSGEFADVFKARLKKDGTGKVHDPPVQVAAKVVTKPSDPRLSRRDESILCKEAAILTRLKPHRNVVGILGLFPNPKHFVLLLEYVNGGSLDEWLFPPDLQAGKRPVDVSLWKHRIDIACQIAEGLTYLHTNKPSIAHMSMKCSNILLQYENSELICKISGFGLSKGKGIFTRSRRMQVLPSSRRSMDHTPGTTQHHLPTATEESRPREVAAAGTSLYMAPEQYSYEVDMSCELSRSLVDIFSFGLILWEIREQALIFQNAPLDVIILQKKKQKIPMNRKECPGCSDKYQMLIRDCYKKNPKERPRCFEILQRLKDMKLRIIETTEHATSTGKDFRNAFYGLSSSSVLQPAATKRLRQEVSADELNQRKPIMFFPSGSNVTSFTGSATYKATRVVQSLTSSLSRASLSTFSEDVIRQHVEQLKAEIGDTETFANAAKLIYRVASSVLTDPEDDKVRRVNTESKSFGPVVWRYVEARALLFHVGFELREDRRIYLSYGANLRGLEILRFLFEDLFPNLSAAKTASASSAVSAISSPLPSAAVTDNVVSTATSGFSRQPSHTESDAAPNLPVHQDLDSLYSVGVLGSLLAFVNHHSHSGHSLREFPSIFAEVKALLSVLFTKDDPPAVLQECWLSVRNDPTNRTGPDSLENYHQNLKSFVELVRQNTDKKYGKTSAEYRIFEYLDRITCARPVVNKAAQDREFLGSIPHFLDENYLKLPDCIPKERFSDAFHQRAESIGVLYKIFVDGGYDFSIIQQLIAHLSWIEVFFTSHFFSNFQLKMKDKNVFEDNDFKHRLELTLKLANKLQRFPSAAFSGSGLFSAAEFHDETLTLLSELEIASWVSPDDVIPRLHRFTDGWSYKDLQKDDKIRDFWNLELEIGVKIFQKWGQEYANAYFFAITVFLIAGGWTSAHRIHGLDRICLTWRGFCHRNVLHFFVDDAADQLKKMSECAEESAVLSELVEQHASKINSCLYLFRERLPRLLKPSL